MKKVFLSVAILASTCFFVSATGVFAPANVTEIAIMINQDGDFTEVKLESLNENVQKAIGAYTEECTVKEIGYNAEKKLTKVVFASKDDQSEKVVILDDEGKEVK
ncbi:MAG: hypothetical protein LBV72_14980 [Tannerella sp.]|jgi:hypothetical protein|nr:hypothetical protein [Tannerella sp.]